MPTFEDLPRELRQEIFKLAFDHAIQTDLDFNENITKYIRAYHGQIRLEVRLSKHLLRVLGPAPAPQDDWHPDSFAPYLCALFEALCAVFPTIVDDTKFVFSKALDTFDEEMIGWSEDERIRFDEKTSWSRATAISQFAFNADGRGELFDIGDGIEECPETLKRHNISEKMARHFNSMITYGERYRWRELN